jgi:hypothetical protein
MARSSSELLVSEHSADSSSIEDVDSSAEPYPDHAGRGKWGGSNEFIGGRDRNLLGLLVDGQSIPV